MTMDLLGSTLIAESDLEIRLCKEGRGREFKPCGSSRMGIGWGREQAAEKSSCPKFQWNLGLTSKRVNLTWGGDVLGAPRAKMMNGYSRRACSAAS